MRSGPSDYRRRSRSPQAATREIRAYWSVRDQHRGGRIWKRRFKSVCLTFLEWFIYLVQSVINFGGNSPAIQNRLRVAQERHAAIIAGYLPRRDETLIQEASEADLSDLDSEVGEAYVIYSSDEEGPEPVGVWSEYLPTLSQPVEPDHPPPFHLQHPWRRVPQPPDHPPPRVPRPPDHSPPSSSASTGHRNLADVIVSSNNPLLRRSQRFAKLHRGTQVFIGSTEPSDQVPIYSNQQKRVICLDYHQVLDRVRGGRNRPDLFLVDESLHPFVQRYLELLGRRFEVWVVSFCCSGYYRNRVKTNCNLPGVSRVILTSERAGRGGKLDAVRAQLTPECLASCFIIDDDKSVNTEWFAASRDGICLEPAGIAVPRKPRADEVTYYPNFGTAIVRRTDFDVVAEHEHP